MIEIRFNCEKCQSKIAVPESMIGDDFICPNCDQKMVIPSKERSALEKKFNCGKCKSKISAPKSMSGDTFDCPHCGNPQNVPEWTTLRESKPEPVVENIETLPHREKEEKFCCDNCKSKIAAPKSMSGETFDCPHCGHNMKVPEWATRKSELPYISKDYSKTSTTSEEDMEKKPSLPPQETVITGQAAALTPQNLNEMLSKGGAAENLSVTAPLLEDKPEVDQIEKKWIVNRNMISAAALVLAFLLLIVIVVVIKTSSTETEGVETKSDVNETQNLEFSNVFKVKKHDRKVDSVEEKWSRALTLENDAVKNKKNYASAIAEFKKIKKSHPRSEYALKVENHIAELRRLRAMEINSVLKSLRDKSNKLLAKNNFEDAIALCKNYKGHFAKETRNKRLKLMDKCVFLKNKHMAGGKGIESALKRKEPSAGETQTKTADLAMDLGQEIVRGKYSKVLASIPGTPENQELKQILSQLRDVKQSLLAFFKKMKGKKLELTLKNKKREVKIIDVANGVVAGSYPIDKLIVKESFKIENLPFRDKVNCLKSMSSEAKSVLIGNEAFNKGKFKVAEKYYKKSGPLAKLLSAQVYAVMSQKREKQAESGLRKLLRKCGWKKNKLVAEEIYSNLSKEEFNRKQTEYIKSSLEDLKKRFGKTDSLKKHDAILLALTEIIEDNLDRIGDEGGEEVDSKEVVAGDKGKVPAVGKALPVNFKIKKPQELQILLIRYNSQYEGNGKVDYVKHKMTGVHLNNKNISDITPLGACKNLDFVNLANNKKISDISALQKLGLKKLFIQKTDVKSISAIAKMDLEELNISSTKITDLTPLRWKRNFKKLYISGNPGIRSIDTLNGTRLSHLFASETSISSIKVLRNLPIEVLDISKTKVMDLSPLKGKRELREINILDTGIVDLSPLRGLKLSKIKFDPKKIKNPKHIDILRKMISIREFQTPYDKKPVTPAKFWVNFETGKYK